MAKDQPSSAYESDVSEDARESEDEQGDSSEENEVTDQHGDPVEERWHSSQKQLREVTVGSNAHTRIPGA